jgi:hypothetical protein
VGSGLEPSSKVAPFAAYPRCWADLGPASAQARGALVKVDNPDVRPASEFERPREITGPVLVRLSRVSEYDLRVEKAGFEPAECLLGEFRPVTIRALDFLFAGGLVVQAAVDAVASFFRRLFRSRRLRLRPVEDGRARVVVRVALRTTRQEPMLLLEPSEPVLVSIVKAS